MRGIVGHLGRGWRRLEPAVVEQRVGSGARRVVRHRGVHVQPGHGLVGDVLGEGEGHAAQVGRPAAERPADDRSIPPVGTTVIIVQKSAIGYVMAEANHAVLYTYDKDKKGATPSCVGSCAATWLPATGTPQAGPADHFPGQFALVKRSDGTQQITYNGMPLYTLKGAKPLLTTGNGQGGVWHVIKLSASDIG